MKNLLLFIAFTAIMIGCKKEDSNLSSGSEVSQKQVIPEAYPYLEGELIEIFMNGQKTILEKKGNNYVWMGDIVFDQKTFDSLKKASSETSNRTFKPSYNSIWPWGVVYFQIDPGFSAGELALISNAIQHWQNNTSLSFVARTTQSNFIRIQPGNAGSGNFSDFIGMKGGMQVVNLETAAFNAGTVIHEIGHAIGFYHEQSRTDRDNSIVINWANIASGKEHNFQTYAALGQAGSQIGQFDFNSIMLYHSLAFSSNGLPTITKTDNSLFFPQSTQLSTGDVETCSFIYGPPFARVEYEQESYNENSGSDYEYISENGIYRVKFYSDENCTIPTLLAENRTISYIVDGIPYQMVCTAGTGVEILSFYSYQYRMEYGNVVTSTSGLASVGADGFWR